MLRLAFNGTSPSPSALHRDCSLVGDGPQVYRLWPVGFDAPNTREQNMLIQFTMVRSIATCCQPHPASRLNLARRPSPLPR